MLNREKLKELGSYILVLCLALFISTHILFSYQVQGSSMEPTLHENQRGFALRTTFGVRVKRFDIVVVEKEDSYLVKRIIGSPNEKVEYKNNQLYINGEFIEEKFLNDTITEDLTIQLSDNEYYCLGDNRSHSADSRTYGAFTKDKIQAILFDIKNVFAK